MILEGWLVLVPFVTLLILLVCIFLTRRLYSHYTFAYYAIAVVVALCLLLDVDEIDYLMVSKGLVKITATKKVRGVR